MRVVKPDETCCLFVDAVRLPYNFGTARAVFFHLLKGHGVGLDANGEPFTYEDMVKRNVNVYADQPVIRSAPVDGKETVWVLPTVFICNHSFFFGKKKKKASASNMKAEKVTARQLWKRYKGVCQFCLKPIKSLSDASHDHVVPRKLGGSDSHENAVLMHKNCNSNLGHTYPKHNVEGKEIVPAKVYATGLTIPEWLEIREEWAPYLFLK